MEDDFGRDQMIVHGGDAGEVECINLPAASTSWIPKKLKEARLDEGSVHQVDNVVRC